MLLSCIMCISFNVLSEASDTCTIWQNLHEPTNLIKSAYVYYVLKKRTISTGWRFDHLDLPWPSLTFPHCPWSLPRWPHRALAKLPFHDDHDVTMTREIKWLTSFPRPGSVYIWHVILTLITLSFAKNLLHLLPCFDMFWHVLRLGPDRLGLWFLGIKLLQPLRAPSQHRCQTSLCTSDFRLQHLQDLDPVNYRMLKHEVKIGEMCSKCMNSMKCVKWCEMYVEFWWHIVKVCESLQGARWCKTMQDADQRSNQHIGKALHDISEPLISKTTMIVYNDTYSNDMQAAFLAEASCSIRILSTSTSFNCDDPHLTLDSDGLGLGLGGLSTILRTKGV